MKHPDKDSYTAIWKKVISTEIEHVRCHYAGNIELVPNAKEEIWDKYVHLNKYCKLNYMISTDKKLDRHKVAACYMLAILKVAPIRLAKKIEDVECSLALNEKLAITVGLSLLCAFSISAINTNNTIADSEKQKLIAKFNGGIKIPGSDLIYHGDYQENYCRELFFGLEEGNLSILSLAHELYLLEVLTKIS